MAAKIRLETDNATRPGFDEATAGLQKMAEKAGLTANAAKDLAKQLDKAAYKAYRDELARVAGEMTGAGTAAKKTKAEVQETGDAFKQFAVKVSDAKNQLNAIAGAGGAAGGGSSGGSGFSGLKANIVAVAAAAELVKKGFETAKFAAEQFGKFSANAASYGVEEYEQLQGTIAGLSDRFSQLGAVVASSGLGRGIADAANASINGTVDAVEFLLRKFEGLTAEELEAKKQQIEAEHGLKVAKELVYKISTDAAATRRRESLNEMEDLGKLRRMLSDHKQKVLDLGESQKGTFEERKKRMEEEVKIATDVQSRILAVERQRMQATKREAEEQAKAAKKMFDDQLKELQDKVKQFSAALNAEVDRRKQFLESSPAGQKLAGQVTDVSQADIARQAAQKRAEQIAAGRGITDEGKIRAMVRGQLDAINSGRIQLGEEETAGARQQIQRGRLKQLGDRMDPATRAALSRKVEDDGEEAGFMGRMNDTAGAYSGGRGMRKALMRADQDLQRGDLSSQGAVEPLKNTVGQFARQQGELAAKKTAADGEMTRAIQEGLSETVRGLQATENRAKQIEQSVQQLTDTVSIIVGGMEGAGRRRRSEMGSR